MSALEDIASERHITLPQLALAWLLAKGDDITPIPGTKRRKYLQENAAAADIQLKPEDIARIEATLAGYQISGERYSEGALKLVNR